VKVDLKTKIYGLAVLAAALPITASMIEMLRFQGRVSNDAEEAMTALARQTVAQTARDIYGMVESANELVQKQVNQNLNVARRIMVEKGRASLSGPEVTWEALDQVTRLPRSVTLPRMMVGGQWLGQVRNPQQYVPVVDDTNRLVSTTVSIFQRMNEQGDMLRVATNLTGADGQRAVGSYVAAATGDGSPNPVVSTVMRGDTYRGIAFGLNAQFLTAYEPLRDGSGRIIGMLVVGERIAGLDALRRAILNTSIGKSGYVCVVGYKGAARGRYIISREGRRDGENIWEMRDQNGRLFVQEELRKTAALPRGEIFTDTYPWQNPGEDQPRPKMAALVYYEPWDWMINASMYEDEYHSSLGSVKSSVRQLLWRSLASGALTLALALGLAYFLCGRISRPIETVTRMARQIAAGDLKAAKTDVAIFDSYNAAAGNGQRRFDLRDESHELVDSFRGMTETLETLIGQVQRSGIQVTTSATGIAASARQLEASVAEQAASTREVSATTTQISATSTGLLNTMNSVTEAVEEAASTAETGHTELTKMEAAMRQLAKSTASISSRLGVISDRASKISTVVTTINKISDQTALLSLNAAIEAEKAGEFGKGFSVVAREISRLADQTAVATQDIESVVREMQSSVSSGVMEMDKFSEEVRRRVDEVNHIGEQLGRIIDHVRALGPEFETAKEGVNAQTQGAQQISEAMSQLALTAEQSREALGEFKQATEQLNAVVQGLKEQVSQFKIGA